MSTHLGIGDVVDSYVIDAVLAAGSTTTTYRATHSRLGRTVALKVFHAEIFAAEPEAREQARRDAVQSARLEHPAIATVYTSGPVGDGMYVASALVNGPSLVDAVAAREITPKRCAEIVTTIAGALETAHAAGVIHREMRPQAVTLDRWGHAVLRDFGVTRLSGRTGLATRLEFGETLRYSAPELILGRPATAAVDVYGLAATAFFCVTGSHAFPDLPIGELVALRTSDAVPQLAGPAELRAVLAAAMSPEPDERPATPSAFAERFAAAVATLSADDARSPSPLRASADPQPPAGVAARERDTTPPPAPEPPQVPADATRVDRQRPAPAAPATPDAGRPWGRIAALTGVVAACAMIGFSLGSVTAPSPPALPQAGSFEIVTGEAWRAGGQGVSAVAAQNSLALTNGGATASIGTLARAGFDGDPIAAGDFDQGSSPSRPAAVRSGARTLVRYQLDDAVVFALATTKATLVAACTPATAASECAGLLSSAKLGSARAVSPVPAKSETRAVAEALRQLEVDRGQAAPELTGPRDGRASAASSLGSDHRSAAETLQGIEGPAAAALRKPILAAANAYEDLGSAIDRGSPTSYRRARRAVVAAERRLRRTFDELRRAGYRVSN